MFKYVPAALKTEAFYIETVRYNKDALEYVPKKLQAAVEAALKKK